MSGPPSEKGQRTFVGVNPDTEAYVGHVRSRHCQENNLSSKYQVTRNSDALQKLTLDWIPFLKIRNRGDKEILQKLALKLYLTLQVRTQLARLLAWGRLP